MAPGIEHIKTIDEFIPLVPKWRCRYAEDGEGAFKVEAFIQRNWASPYLTDPNPKVNSLISTHKGKEDLADLKVDLEVVYRWGGGFGPMIFAQIIKNNPPAKVQQHMQEAYKTLEEGDPVTAREQITTLKNCSDSFGTKVLAMRAPWIAPIWDNLAKGCLNDFRIGGRPVKSYAQFIKFCDYIADELKRLTIAPPLGPDGSPREVNGRWYLRDIEMAIFQFAWAAGKTSGRITGALP